MLKKKRANLGGNIRSDHHYVAEDGMGVWGGFSQEGRASKGQGGRAKED